MTLGTHIAGEDPQRVADTAGKVSELADEVDQLKHAVRSHATVDQAIGVVLAVGRLSPDEAWDVIREVSMRTNTKLRDVSEEIVKWGYTGTLDGGLRVELERQLCLREQADAEPDGQAAS